MTISIGTREGILAAKDLPEETIEVQEWGCAIKIRALTLAQRARTTEASVNKGQVNTSRAAILTFIEGVIEPKFTLADYDALREKSAVIEKIALRIMALSGVGSEALESLQKNSESSPSDDSSLN